MGVQYNGKGLMTWNRESQWQSDAKNRCLRLLLCQNANLPSPCFVIDEDRLRENTAILEHIQNESGVRILLALKGFSAWRTFPLLSRMAQGPLFGVCASSVDEARLGREEFGGEVHAFAAAWSEEEMRELLLYADHITFNSIQQWHTFRELIEKTNAGSRKSSPVQCGLRLNPEHSEGAPDIYNPCAPNSRLGIRKNALPPPDSADWQNLDGFHFHTLCEQDADALARTLTSFEKKFSPWLDHIHWFNFGGGHHITRKGYQKDLLINLIQNWQKHHPGQIYLEPGEAVALNAGWLSCTILDIVEADIPVAILDTSASCHMPDVLEMPYRPEAWYCLNDEPSRADAPRKFLYTCRLAGKSCLAGDNIGEYSFERPLKTGDKIVFADMAIYSMVKTTTFNGIRLPAIAGFSEKNGFDIWRTFSHNDFKKRLS